MCLGHRLNSAVLAVLLSTVATLLRPGGTRRDITNTRQSTRGGGAHQFVDLTDDPTVSVQRLGGRVSGQRAADYAVCRDIDTVQ